MSAPLVEAAFVTRLIHWRGPAPFVFASVPEEHVPPIRAAARGASYGWGVVPVEVEIGGTAFTTSLFPRDSGYLLPLKVAVRRALGVEVGDEVAVVLRVVTAT